MFYNASSLSDMFSKKGRLPHVAQDALNGSIEYIFLLTLF